MPQFDERYQQHIQSLSQRLPALAERMHHFTNTHSGTKTQTQEGIITFEWTNLNNQQKHTVTLNSQHYSAPALREQFSPYDPTRQALLLMGIDAVALPLLKTARLSALSPVIIVEEDTALFISWLGLLENDDFLLQDNVWFFVGDNAEAQLQHAFEHELAPYWLSCHQLHAVQGMCSLDKSDADRARLQGVFKSFNEQHSRVKRIQDSFLQKHQQHQHSSKKISFILPHISCWVMLGRQMAEGFANQGYETQVITIPFPPTSMNAWQTLKNLYDVQAFCPDCLFTMSHPSDFFLMGIEGIAIPRLIWYVDLPFHLLQHPHGEHDHIFYAFLEFEEQLRHRGGRLRGTLYCGSSPMISTRKNEYTCDVSFVGSIRTNSATRDILPETMRAHIDSMTDNMLIHPDFSYMNLLEENGFPRKIQTTLLQALRETQPLSYMSDEQLLAFFLNTECMRKRRVNLLLALEGFNVKIFGNEAWAAVLAGTGLEGAYQGCGLAVEETWSLYKSSTIALSIHPTYPHTGPTSRDMDIPASGGFALSDIQRYSKEKTADFFTLGIEVATFDNPADLRQQVEHYLSNPEERQAITRRAQARINKDHQFTKRAAEMLKQAGQTVHP